MAIPPAPGSRKISPAAFDSFDPLLDYAEQSAQNGGDAFKLRTSAFQVVDYYKSALDVLGTLCGFPIVEEHSLERKFELACDRLPQLRRWSKMIVTVARLRVYAAHKELSIPRKGDIDSATAAAREFRKDLEEAATRWTSGMSEAQQLEAELNACDSEIGQLKKDFPDFAALGVEFDEYIRRHSFLREVSRVLTASKAELIPSLIVDVKALSRQVSQTSRQLEQEIRDQYLADRFDEEPGYDFGSEPADYDPHDQE